VIFVTSNVGKAEEAKKILSSVSIDIEHKDFEIPEPRGTLEYIAMNKALYAYSVFKQPLFVEDSGLFIEALNGFPGSFSSFALKKIGPEGILKLLADQEKRSAYFKCVLAYVDNNGIKTFIGISEGRISHSLRGSDGFGFDPIFIPKGYSETFAENISLKNKTSHRYKSLLKFKKYLEGLNG